MTLRVPGLFLAALCLFAALRAAEPQPAPAPTVITSREGDMVSTDTETTFTFAGDVVVTGTNLKITCDRLVVVARRTGDPKATIGKQDKFKSLVATGNVHILQSDREMFCERAEIFPGEDKVVLTGNPRWRTTDGQYSGDGPELTFYRGERRAVISRPRFVLPPLKDLGYEPEPKKKPAPGASDPNAKK